MLGAIAGDVIGSRWEHARAAIPDTYALFDPACRFTDDTVLTVAVAHALLDNPPPDYARHLLTYARRWPRAGYGGAFKQWMYAERPRPYGSFGNGSAMRASAVGWAFDDADAVLREAAASAAPTHDHPDGIAGAQAVALAVFRLRTGATPDAVRAELATRVGYDLSRSVAEIRPGYVWDVTCPGSVPEAITCALEARDFEDAVRLAISLRGDADTQACIAGAIAEARWGVPDAIAAEVPRFLDPALHDVLARFRARFRARFVAGRFVAGRFVAGRFAGRC